MTNPRISALAVLALSACTISTGDDDDPRLTDSAALFDRLAGQSPTLPSDMPVSGSAIYDGFATLFTDIDGRSGFILGDATIVARFADGPDGIFSGTVTDLIDVASDPLPGAIAFSGTSAGSALTGSLSGGFVAGDETLNVSGRLTGAYGGRAAASFFADTSGSISDEDRLRGSFDGSIFGER